MHCCVVLLLVKGRRSRSSAGLKVPIRSCLPNCMDPAALCISHCAAVQRLLLLLSAASGHSLILSLGGANTKVELLWQSLCIKVQAMELHRSQVNSTILRLGWWTDNNLANLLWIQTSLLWPAYVIVLSWPRLYLLHPHTQSGMTSESLSFVTFTWWGSHTLVLAFKLSFIYYSCLDVINGTAFGVWEWKW